MISFVGHDTHLEKFFYDVAGVGLYGVKSNEIIVACRMKNNEIIVTCRIKNNEVILTCSIKNNFSPFTYRKHAAVAEYLINQGCDVKAGNKHKRTPAHEAAIFGHAHILRLLQDRGADLSATV